MTYVTEMPRPPDVDVVELAERYLELTLGVLTDALHQLSSVEVDEDEVVCRAALEVVTALRMLFILRARIEDDERRTGTTGADPGGIDLEHARSSIGSLLDRLRDEDGSEEVSE